ncbi:hypothetical protein PFICI_14319 [Pestalotiopsis fici W106-1]|uniref:CENP-V/GFA domain-containing protein n=1 Tax=Pestalotiopsis fici (strain W106-1 / CGMCC3.15140) TaxID=1229662 RepID=W3WKP2_PESFW|nr:uncharacterized protein PFICI_14319 [Pestalotiopsis fici W106-1]ETS74453.1 hypothetical protein PFICI_14319 [Pestalotiopsis fici W106-1]
MTSVEDSQSETLTLKAQCHCGLASFAIDIPTSALPLRSSICSCNSCRRVTAQLFATHVAVPGNPLPDVSKWTSYNSSASLTRVFCPRCGCSVLCHGSTGAWFLCGGVLEGPIQGIQDRQALFANDSKDGGGYIWLPEKNGVGNVIQHHGDQRGSEMVDVEAMRRNFAAEMTTSSTQEPGQDDTLQASCHCGAFQCHITKPDPETPGPMTGRGKWWLAEDSRRYWAGLDACRSCRKVTGYEVNSWAYIPAFNFRNPDGTPLDPATHPALHHYSSSPGVHRDFCATCGASVFFRRESRDPQVWDIGAGLLRGRGARAEDWLQWNTLDFAEFALDPEFVSGIVEKMQSYKAAH